MLQTCRIIRPVEGEDGTVQVVVQPRTQVIQNIQVVRLLRQVNLTYAPKSLTRERKKVVLENFHFGNTYAVDYSTLHETSRISEAHAAFGS